MKKWVLVILLFVVCLSVSATRASAAYALPNHEESQVVFEYRGSKWVYGAREYYAASKIHTVEEEAARRRLPTHHERVSLCRKLVALNMGYKPAVEHVFIGISRVTERIKCCINKPPQPATIRFKPQTAEFVIKKEVCGFELNLESLYKKVFLALENSPRARIKLTPEVLNHDITSEVLKACCNKRASFTTGYERSSPERKHNVCLALKKLNGARLNGGDVLSFNQVVGARTARRGFKEAKIIKNGQYENGVGGGVCQSSTTLYNAALLGGLKVLKVYQHSLPIGYVEPSFDAMVNSSFADLVLQNEGELPVFIRTVCGDSTVTCEVYGSPLPYRIVRRSVQTGVVPHGGDRHVVDKEGKYAEFVQYKGDVVRISAPKNGLTSLGYLDYYQGNRLISTEQIRKNKYNPQKGLLVEGTKPKPTELETINESERNNPS